MHNSSSRSAVSLVRRFVRSPGMRGREGGKNRGRGPGRNVEGTDSRLLVSKISNYP
jgi:hypothetical protein